MLPISIDISPILQEYSAISNRGAELSAFILDRIVDDYMYNWEQNVGKELNSTRQEYMSAMSVNRVDEYNAVISLTPTESNLALMIEDGASSFDMMEGFKNSEKAQDKDGGGWYLTVPFRHATTEALGESSIFSNQLPKTVQEAVRKQPINIVTGNTHPLKNMDLPAKYQSILGSNKTSGYEHKHSIYEGVRRESLNSTNKENRGGHFSFRRVSDKSDEGSWIHPGFKPHRFMEKTLNETNIDSIVSMAIDDFIADI